MIYRTQYCLIFEVEKLFFCTCYCKIFLCVFATFSVTHHLDEMLLYGIGHHYDFLSLVFEIDNANYFLGVSVFAISPMTCHLGETWRLLSTTLSSFGSGKRNQQFFSRLSVQREHFVFWEEQGGTDGRTDLWIWYAYITFNFLYI
jgi:hypothetical protein